MIDPKPGALSSTLGAALLVYGIVHSAETGWGDTVTLVTLTAGVVLVVGFVIHEARAEHPLLPLRLFTGRQRAGALTARALCNGVLLSTFYFLTLYLQGVSGDSPFQTGLAFLPQTAIGFVVAAAVPSLTRRVGNHRVAVAGAIALASPPRGTAASPSTPTT